MTSLQLRLLGMARRWAEKTIEGFDEAQYRIILRNVGEVAEDGEGHVSSKALTQRGFELVMAWFESVGYRQDNSASDYWQKKAARSSRGQITDRQIRMIEDLVAQIREGQPMFGLGGFVRRMTNHRTADHTALWAREANNLIEALKAIVGRGPQQQAPATLSADETSQIERGCEGL